MTSSQINYQTTYSNQIFLNSKNADVQMNGTKKSSVVFFFNDIFKTDKKTIEQRVEVVNAQVPISWYLINSTNNMFYLNSVATYFPVGNYNVNTFITTWIATFGANWTVSFSTITNQFTFTNTANFSLSDGINSIFNIIGFLPGKVYNSVSLVLTSAFSVNFGGLQKVNIKSASFTLANCDSKNKSVSKTMASVPVSSIQAGYIFYNNITGFKSIFKNHEISSINIDIQDDFGNFIDFNNVDWSLTLQVDIVSEIVQSLDNLEDVYLTASTLES